MKLTFLGGAGTVTGSRYLVDQDNNRILIDCGLFEGPKSLRLKNWQPFPVDPSSINAIVLTHAHLDHSGYLPRLVKQGYSGPIICTGGTRDLCHLLLKDTARLMEEEAEYYNRHEISKHKPALPLYTLDDVEKTLRLFRTKHFGSLFEVGNLHVEFNRSGHILGSAHIRITNPNNTRLTITSEVGRSQNTIMRPPEPLLPADFLVVESSYGDRVHSSGNPKTDLQLNIIECLSKGGSLLMPAYPVGRTQQILHTLYLLKRSREIPRLPIFLDSPMSSDITYLYCAYRNDHQMDDKICAALFDDVYFSVTQEESRSIAAHAQPKIVISASGMATGGRVLHHIKKMAPDERNTILFTGYQASGTRGATMVSGAPFVKIHGEYIKVSAKVVNLEDFSANADSNELADWFTQSQVQPKHVFITHGETQESFALKRKLEKELNWKCTVPQLNQAIVLEDLSEREESYGIFN